MLPKYPFELARLKYTKPLFWLAVISVVGAVAVVPFWIFDPRELGGVSIWEKPLKFFISSAIFSFTFSWLSSFITKGYRWVKILGRIIAIALAVELILITSMAALGTRSHFNVSTPAAIVVWSLMATFISFVLLSTLCLSIMILFQKQQDFDIKLTLVLGGLNTSVGMGLAYLMTRPTASQLVNFHGIAGAHSVGIEDGGPDLPLLGWSTVAGDLRVGHFFGLHSLQVAAILLMASFLVPIAFRVPLIVVGNLTWLGFVGLVTWQSLRAEPFSSPSELTIISFVGLLSFAVLAFVALSLIRSRTKSNSMA